MRNPKWKSEETIDKRNKDLLLLFPKSKYLWGLPSTYVHLFLAVVLVVHTDTEHLVHPSHRSLPVLISQINVWPKTWITLSLLAQLSSELFIKRSAYTKVVGIHNIQKLDLKNSWGGGLWKSLVISNQAFWLEMIGLEVAFKNFTARLGLSVRISQIHLKKKVTLINFSLMTQPVSSFFGAHIGTRNLKN